MKKTIIAMLFLAILAISVNAQVCQVSDVKMPLRKNLYLYFTNPSASTLTLNQVKDLLIFYLSIPSSSLSVDCSSIGSMSSTPILNIITTGQTAPDTIPLCGDGTKYGECSTNKPKHCYSGNLINKCSACGCPSNLTCSNENCQGQIQSCPDGTAYGQCSASRPSYCMNGTLTPLCGLCGCSGSGTCNVNGTCSYASNITECSDGTPINSCSTNNPWRCNSTGSLVQNCMWCGCLGGNTCTFFGNCLTNNSCFDSDNGLNYAITGGASKGMSSGADFCSTSSNLREFYCQNDAINSTNYAINSTNYACPGGCAMGRCI